jgi:hypothetical protein
MSGRQVDHGTFLKLGNLAAEAAARLGLDDSLLLGVWRAMLPIPRPVWQSQVRGDTNLDFMTDEHHWVRDLVVLEIPRVGEPLTPEFIAQALDLPLPQVASILDDLEKHMTFLFRNEQGAVTWAYPVTVDKTPHRVTFSSGEQAYAA